MTVTEDASTPAVAATGGGSAATTLASASFSPPAGSVLQATCEINYSTAPGVFPTVTISDSASGTWTAGPGISTTAAGALVATFTRPCVSAPGSITVTMSRGADNSAAMLALAVRVLNGANTSSPQGASNTASAVSGGGSATIAATVTPQQVGSLVYVGGVHADTNTSTVLAGTTSIYAQSDGIDGGYLSVGVAGPTVSLSPLTPGFSATLGAGAGWIAAVLEIVPASTTPPFPQGPLDLRTEINVAGWVNVTSNKVYQREGTSPPLTITRGRPDESSQVTPSSAAWQANNRNGNLSPKNPLGTWYGLLGRNTPVRHSVPAIGNYLRLEDAASAAICPDVAALDFTGDTDIRIDMTVTGVGPSGTVIAAKGNNSIYTGSQSAGWSWVLGIAADLTPVLMWSANGTTLDGIVQGLLPVPARGRFALRATLAVATGTVTFYTAPTMAGSFTQLGPAASGTNGNSTSVHAGALGAPLTAGWSAAAAAPAQLFTGGGQGLCGRVWELQLLNGIGGTLVADPVFSAQTAGATSFTDAKSNVWGMYGTAEISSRDYRYHGELSSLPPKWDETGTDQYVAVTAGGLLRRLGQGNALLLSPMARYYTVPGAPACAAYWAMEDAAGSTQLGGAIGQLPMFFSGTPTLASSSVFTGSSPLPVSNSASFTGPVAYAGTWTDNDVHWLMQLPSAPEPDGTIVAVIAVTGSVLQQLTVTYNTASSGSLTLKGYDVNGNILFTAAAAAVSLNGKAIAVQAYLQASGAVAGLTVHVPGQGTGSGTTTAFTGTIGAVRRVSLNPNGALTATVFGHCAVLPSYVAVTALSGYLLPGGTHTGPVTAWTGEPAGVRAGRLTLEQSMQFRGIGSLSGTAAMGPQSATGLVSLLQECETADRGMIFEPRACLGLGYRARSSLYNQVPLVLDYAQAKLGGTGTMPEPTYDDQYIRNDETVSRSGGSSSGASARYVLNDGSPMSISPPPAGAGTYTNSDSLNVASDGQLLNEAAWIAHIGTVNEARWPLIPLNLARSQLTALWYSLLDQDIGDRFQVPNLPNVVLYDAADQLMAQGKEMLGGFFYQMEWCAIPASPYTVAVAGTARAATAGSNLASPASSGVTTLSVQTVTGNIWTTAAGDFPFDINVGGERITVTAITGSSFTQTFSVTRSVNGVVLAHAALTPVQVWTPAVAAL